MVHVGLARGLPGRDRVRDRLLPDDPGHPAGEPVGSTAADRRAVCPGGRRDRVRRPGEALDTRGVERAAGDRLPGNHVPRDADPRPLSGSFSGVGRKRQG